MVQGMTYLRKYKITSASFQDKLRDPGQGSLVNDSLTVEQREDYKNYIR